MSDEWKLFWAMLPFGVVGLILLLASYMHWAEHLLDKPKDKNKDN